MLALRSFARNLPRATFRAAPVRIAQRQIPILRPSLLSRALPYKAFSTTRIWKEAAGDGDAELSAKLNHERELELGNQENAALPQDLQDFLADSLFTVQDQPGTENIILTKQFGNETIRIECSIADMNAEQELEDDLEDDATFEDEPEELASGGKRTINQSGIRGGKVDVAPEDSIAPADREVGEDISAELNAFPLNLNITIDKGGIGATNIIAEASDGVINLEYVHYLPRASLIDPKTAEEAKQAQTVYRGPPFSHLDQDLQTMYENYVRERGVNEQLAWFLTRYVDYKEQREYVLWLENMKKFVDA